VTAKKQLFFYHIRFNLDSVRQGQSNEWTVQSPVDVLLALLQLLPHLLLGLLEGLQLYVTVHLAPGDRRRLTLTPLTGGLQLLT